MARYAISGRTSGAGSTTLPSVSLYATATVAPKVVEVGVFQTTSTAVALRLVKLSSTGTQGAGLTEVADGIGVPAASCTAFDAHSVAPTIASEHRRTVLAAAPGAATIWTFDDLTVPVGTGNGIGIITSTGTGQVFDYYIVWEE